MASKKANEDRIELALHAIEAHLQEHHPHLRTMPRVVDSIKRFARRQHMTERWDITDPAFHVAGVLDAYNQAAEAEHTPTGNYGAEVAVGERDHRFTARRLTRPTTGERDR